MKKMGCHNYTPWDHKVGDFSTKKNGLLDVRVIWKGEEVRYQYWRNIQSTKSGIHETCLPINKRNRYKGHKNPLPQSRRETQRQGDKNGMVIIRNIQVINIRPVTLILKNHVNRHETSTKLCLFQGRCAAYHHKVNYERCIRVTNQTSNNNNKASGEPSALYIIDTVTRAWRNPHMWACLYSTA